MKTLADGTEVSSRSYYYLLDWNEENEWEFLIGMTGKNKLCDLNREEYVRLFAVATSKEFVTLKG